MSYYNSGLSGKVLRSEIVNRLKSKRLIMLTELTLHKVEAAKIDKLISKKKKEMLRKPLPKGTLVTFNPGYYIGQGTYRPCMVFAVDTKKLGIPEKTPCNYSSHDLEEITKVIELLSMSDQRYVFVRSIGDAVRYL